MRRSIRRLRPGIPIEVEFPDIRRWRPGNVGLDYVWSFAGDAPGPHLAVVALVHGNEFCGAISLDRLLARFVEGRLRPRQGRVSFILANPEAYLAFDPQRPLASRALDEDMNRLWDAHTLESARTSRELARARALRPRIDTVDHLIDLHSMSLPSPPLVLAGDTAKGVALARALALPCDILIDSGHAAGRRLRDDAGFGDPGSPKPPCWLNAASTGSLRLRPLRPSARGAFSSTSGWYNGLRMCHGLSQPRGKFANSRSRT
ncbi:MAG: succinylglutamate desuccinylase/aspartoacylase family protein [Burkholderiales bacterium]|nr:succinylglutamate desuccinylase/aspartoacylase family protein [Burkholderiales bacterium]